MLYYSKEGKGSDSMYKNCQTEQSVRRQRQLEKGLLQMMLHRAYEDITVGELCAQLQIPRKSFYRYFSGKEGALYSLIDHTLEDFYRMPVPAPKSRGNAVGDLDLFFAFWYDNKLLLDALRRNSLSGILVERANRFALREGFFPQKFKAIPEQTREIGLSFAVCGLMAMTLSWHSQGFPISPDEMTRLAMGMLTTPLVTP